MAAPDEQVKHESSRYSLVLFRLKKILDLVGPGTPDLDLW